MDESCGAVFSLNPQATPFVPSCRIGLLDLDTELLSDILSRLSAKHQGAAVQACKLLALLVRENTLDETYLVGAVTSSVEEAQASLSPRMTSPPSFGVLFSNGCARRRARLASIQKLVYGLPPAHRA
jgi:hypothetical protein